MATPRNTKGLAEAMVNTLRGIGRTFRVQLNTWEKKHNETITFVALERCERTGKGRHVGARKGEARQSYSR
jgi:hypothetical protein